MRPVARGDDGPRRRCKSAGVQQGIIAGVDAAAAMVAGGRQRAERAGAGDRVGRADKAGIRRPMERALQQAGTNMRQRQLLLPVMAARPIGEHRRGDALQPGHARPQGGDGIHECGAGRAFIVDHHQRARLRQQGAAGCGDRAEDHMCCGVAVRFGKFGNNGLAGGAGPLPGRMDEQQILPASARRIISVAAVRQADGGFGHAEKYNRPRQIRYAGGAVAAQQGIDQAASAIADCGWRGGQMPAQHFGHHQKAAPGIVAGGKAAQIIDSERIWVWRA